MQLLFKLTVLQLSLLGIGYGLILMWYIFTIWKNVKKSSNNVEENLEDVEQKVVEQLLVDTREFISQNEIIAQRN